MEFEVENLNNRMEPPPSPFKVFSVPGSPQPLQPISSERQNQQRIPQSPSFPSNLDVSSSPRKTQHRLSDAADVRARVAYLNAIAQPGSPTRSASPPKSHTPVLSNAAIQRAMLGREEAEGALGALSAQIESYKARERSANERIDQLQNQLNESRNRQKHERGVYEKEIKVNKKAEFKAEMAVIKLQEDLREVRTELESYKGRSEHEKAEKEKARQEAFERAYAIAGMTEEMADLKQRLEIAEQERDAAVATAASKMSAQEEDVRRAEVKHEQDAGEKRKQPILEFDFDYFDEEDLKAPDCPLELKYYAAKVELEFLRDKVQADQATIEFMNLSCQFMTCSCRMAERNGVRFVHDYEYDAKTREQRAKKRKLAGLGPEPPIARHRSWIEEREEAEAKAQSADKGKQPVRAELDVHHHSNKGQNPREQNTTPQVHNTAVVELEVAIEEPAAPLPPVETETSKFDATQSLTLMEAANIPLPSAKPTDGERTDDSLEPTAQLEDLTQVLVEQGDSAQNFLFSMSTTSNKAVAEPVATMRQSHGIRMSDDLFDISPPKRQMPPRPSTAMGLLTVESPTGLAPHSSQRFQSRSALSVPDTAPPKTTRVALNDTSPVRQARQQRHQPRHQPRQNAGERIRGRSPGPVRSADLTQLSPAQSTLFPITPVVKQERARRPHATTQSRPQTAQDHYPSTRKEVLSTTTIPLRDDTEQRQAVSSATSSESNHNTQNESSASGTPFSVPGTPSMTREQALAQIRARRDRARSINMRKSADEGSKTPGSAARRGINLKEKLGVDDQGKNRDFSQASAPGRI